MTFKASPTFSDDLPPQTREALRMMIGQLPIVFALRAGGTLRIPATEVDATGGYMLNMAVENGDFVFTVSKKQ
jgi:hypothetical protein